MIYDVTSLDFMYFIVELPIGMFGNWYFIFSSDIVQFLCMEFGYS